MNKNMLVPKQEGDPTIKREGEEKRVEDIDTAREMAETETPLKEKMAELAARGISKDEIEKAFNQKLDREAEEARKLYEEVNKRVDYLMINAAKNGEAQLMGDSLSDTRETDEKRKEMADKIASIIREREQLAPDSNYSFNTELIYETREGKKYGLWGIKVICSEKARPIDYSKDSAPEPSQ